MSMLMSHLAGKRAPTHRNGRSRPRHVCSIFMLFPELVLRFVLRRWRHLARPHAVTVRRGAQRQSIPPSPSFLPHTTGDVVHHISSGWSSARATIIGRGTPPFCQRDLSTHHPDGRSDVRVRQAALHEVLNHLNLGGLGRFRVMSRVMGRRRRNA